MACARVLRPVYDLMCRRVQTSYALYTDDTPLTLLNPRRTAYAWVYVSDRQNPYTVFDLTVGHGHEHPERFLAGYRGFIHADGYTGYNPLYAAGATHIGCWMHVRRKFFDAKMNDPARRTSAGADSRALRGRSQGQRQRVERRRLGGLSSRTRRTSAAVVRRLAGEGSSQDDTEECHG